MIIKVFGSGAWEGIPAPFCDCVICEKAKSDPKDKNTRTRPQFLITTDLGGFFVEASPDIRLQSGTIKAEYTDFLVSHAHHDHITGLRDLHTWSKKVHLKPTIFCSPQTEKFIKNELSYLPINTKVVVPFESFVLNGVTITALPVYHEFLKEDALPEDKLQSVFAFLFECDGKKVAYLADYYKILSSTLEKIKGMDVVIADGTYLFTENYKGAKLNHLHGKEIIDFTQSLNAKKVYYHSISHLTGMDHDQLQSKLPSGHFLTYDGLEI